MWRSSDVGAVLVIPFTWKGSRRKRGLALAERFIRDFGPVTLIDNELIGGQVMADRDEILLGDLYDEINVHAAAHVEEVIAASRDA